MVLELARIGQPGVVAVTSFHGELGNLTEIDNTNVHAAVQVHHADLDFQGPQVSTKTAMTTQPFDLGFQGSLRHL